MLTCPLLRSDPVWRWLASTDPQLFPCHHTKTMRVPVPHSGRLTQKVSAMLPAFPSFRVSWPSPESLSVALQHGYWAQDKAHLAEQQGAVQERARC